MNARAVSRYQKVQVNTSSPAELVSMLLDGAIRFANEAADAMAKDERGRAGERINRCHAVVEALAASLDPSASPELCDNLMGVYAFCMRRLLDANLQRDPKVLGEVVRALAPLRDAWAELAARR